MAALSGAAGIRVPSDSGHIHRTPAEADQQVFETL
jgi:hypothetical protein